MLHSRQNKNKIKHLHERCLRCIQNDKLSSYEKLLEKDGSVSVHHRNIQGLATEVIQIKHDQSREIVTNIFTQTTEQYNCKQDRDFRIRSINTVYHGFESTSYLDPKIGKIFGKFNSPNIFQKGNQKLSTTKLPLQASEAVYKWCLFSPIISSCICYIQSICLTMLSLDFNNFYVFVSIF